MVGLAVLRGGESGESCYFFFRVRLFCERAKSIELSSFYFLRLHFTFLTSSLKVLPLFKERDAQEKHTLIIFFTMAQVAAAPLLSALAGRAVMAASSSALIRQSAGGPSRSRSHPSLALSGSSCLLSFNSSPQALSSVFSTPL